MVRFTGVEINDCPQLLSVSLMTRWLSSVSLWKKSSLVFTKPRRRARVQKLSAIVLASAGHGSVQFLPKLSPAQSLHLSG